MGTVELLRLRWGSPKTASLRQALTVVYPSRARSERDLPTLQRPDAGSPAWAPRGLHKGLVHRLTVFDGTPSLLLEAFVKSLCSKEAPSCADGFCLGTRQVGLAFVQLLTV